jgi:hypothetical protein
LSLVVPAAVLSCTSNPTPEATPREFTVLSARELYPIALERAQQELGDVALLSADVVVAPIQEVSFEFISIKNPRESVGVSIDPGAPGDELTTHRYTTKEPPYLGHTIQPEDMQDIDSGGIPVAYDAMDKRLCRGMGRPLFGE